MQIILPAHNKKAEEVKSWAEIMNDAMAMRNMMIAKKFFGNWSDAHALSHAQVSEEPKSFFVLNDIWIPVFKSWCVVNPKIIWKDVEIEHKEACMSFPYRKEVWTKRYAKIVVFYWTPLWGFLFPRIKYLKEMPAFIVQHELEHARGSNIYGLK